MANDDVIGPRKTMFILVIVVGCFAVLWPRILSPLLLGPTKQQLQPNQFDRDAGCCEVMFGSELAVLELINEVCSSVVHIDGKISPYAASECRKAVNETCGVDIAAFLKRTDNVGKTSKLLVQTMQSSNSSCLKEHFGVPVLSLGPHLAYNSLTLPDTMKQERAPIRGAGPHPALRERGRAIPSAPVPARSSQIQMPPNVRVRSPLEGYFQLDIKPPPIPGMRPPLGSAGGPQAAPKSSMGLVMPLYTLCIIIFFVYTLSKLFFKRATVEYEEVAPDPVFRRRVFRDDSRSTPDKLVVSAISGLVAEVRQQMETSYQQNEQTQERQDNHTRPYTNGKVLHNTGPVHIVASEYQKDKSPEPKETSPAPKETSPEPKETSPEPKETSPEPKEASPEAKEASPEPKEASPEAKEASPEPKEASPEAKEASPEPKEATPEPKEASPGPKLKSALEEVIEEIVDKESGVKAVKELLDQDKEIEVEEEIEDGVTEEEDPVKYFQKELVKTNDILDLSEPANIKKIGEMISIVSEAIKEADKAKTKLLLGKALVDEDEEEVESEEEPEEPEKSSVKVLGMELRAESADGAAFPPPNNATPQSHAHHAPAAPPVATRTPHEAEEVKSIFLDTEIPQKSRVLVDFADDVRDQTPPAKHSPTVVSGKMTLSLIQDAPRETPERDPESTVDDFTTASALTQDVAEKEGSESEEEVEEEIEIEEIEEEVEEEEIEEDEEEKPQPVKKETN